MSKRTGMRHDCSPDPHLRPCACSLGPRWSLCVCVSLNIYMYVSMCVDMAVCTYLRAHMCIFQHTFVSGDHRGGWPPSTFILSVPEPHPREGAGPSSEGGP